MVIGSNNRYENLDAQKRYTRILDIFQQLKRCPMDMHGCTWKEQKKT